MLEQLKLQVHECKKEIGGADHTPHFPVPVGQVHYYCMLSDNIEQ